MLDNLVCVIMGFGSGLFCMWAVLLLWSSEKDDIMYDYGRDIYNGKINPYQKRHGEYNG